MNRLTCHDLASEERKHPCHCFCSSHHKQNDTYMITKVENIYSDQITKVENIYSDQITKVENIYSDQITKVENIYSDQITKVGNIYSDQITKVEGLAALTKCQDHFEQAPQFGAVLDRPGGGYECVYLRCDALEVVCKIGEKAHDAELGGESVYFGEVEHVLVFIGELVEGAAVALVLSVRFHL